MIRADIRADEDRCPECFKPLGDAQLERVIAPNGDVDLLAICRSCGQPKIIPWVREAA